MVRKNPLGGKNIYDEEYKERWVDYVGKRYTFINSIKDNNVKIVKNDSLVNYRLREKNLIISLKKYKDKVTERFQKLLEKVRELENIVESEKNSSKKIEETLKNELEAVKKGKQLLDKLFIQMLEKHNVQRNDEGNYTTVHIENLSEDLVKFREENNFLKQGQQDMDTKLSSLEKLEKEIRDNFLKKDLGEEKLKKLQGFVLDAGLPNLWGFMEENFNSIFSVVKDVENTDK